MDWFMVKADNDPMTFFISIFSVRIEPSGTEVDTGDFLEQCVSFHPDRNGFTTVCNDVLTMSRCFLAFLIIMLVQIAFNMHTLITMYLIVKKRVTSQN